MASARLSLTLHQFHIACFLPIIKHPIISICSMAESETDYDTPEYNHHLITSAWSFHVQLDCGHCPSTNIIFTFLSCC